MEWSTILACPSPMCFNRGDTEGTNSSKILWCVVVYIICGLMTCAQSKMVAAFFLIHLLRWLLLKLTTITPWSVSCFCFFQVVVAKIISLLVLTILSVLTGLLPLRLLLHFPQLFTHHRQTVDYFLRGLRCLSGGVFLATGFLHLLPDTREKMAAVLVNLGSRTKYAVTELLIMAGQSVWIWRFCS